MAKISARGDSPRKTWKSVSGARYVLTHQGRLLFRSRDDGYRVCAKYDTREGGQQDATLMNRLEEHMHNCGFMEM